MMADKGSTESALDRQCDRLATTTRPVPRRTVRAATNPGASPILLTLSGLTGHMKWSAGVEALGPLVNMKSKR
ncbi:hypothetical protein LL06_21980 [Hoeflea sp. BAL378]|nr:hypothetical protein LL06_21980 [Hoeflea sp. BAL378]